MGAPMGLEPSGNCHGFQRHGLHGAGSGKWACRTRRPDVLTPDELKLYDKVREAYSTDGHSLHRLPVLHALSQRRGYPPGFRVL